MGKMEVASEKIEWKNKALVLEAFDTLFNNRDYAAAERFWSLDYIQHSAHIAPGREAAQAGLSWSIMLKKREGYRRAFSEFDPEKVARYTENRIQKLTLNPAIIRNRMKIEAAVRNAQAFLAIQEELGSFDAYCWLFVDGRPKLNHWKAMREIPATSPESGAFSKDLKHRGFSFVGSTVVYAHMQAVGMVNDHLVDCFRYPEIRLLP